MEFELGPQGAVRDALLASPFGQNRDNHYYIDRVLDIFRRRDMLGHGVTVEKFVEELGYALDSIEQGMGKAQAGMFRRFLRANITAGIIDCLVPTEAALRAVAHELAKRALEGE